MLFKVIQIESFCSLCWRRFLSLSHDVILTALYEDPCFLAMCERSVARTFRVGVAHLLARSRLWLLCFHQKWGGFILMQISSTYA